MRDSLAKLLIVLWSLLAGSAVNAQESPKSLLFSNTNDSVLEMQLQGPWSDLAADLDKAPEQRPAQLTLTTHPTIKIKVKPRGKSRRRRHFCQFPPLQLDLPKDDLQGTPLHGLNKVKLVTQCVRMGKTTQQPLDRLWSEYLLYRVFNIVEPQSFRVQALNISYVNVDGNHLATHPGFLIEPKQLLATRVGMNIVKTKMVAIPALDAASAAVVNLFQYFAGNTDFSLIRSPGDDDCCHNTVPMRGERDVIQSFAYDFDATGFVDPPYGGPLPSLNIDRYTNRLFRGYCHHNDHNAAAVAKFMQARDEIFSLIEGFPHITKARRKKLIRFSKAFYKKLEATDPVGIRLNHRCR